MAGFLGNLKISTRLGAGFAILLILLCGISTTALYQASRIYGSTEDLADNWLPSVAALGNVRALANSVRRASLRSVLEIEPAGKQAQRAQHDKALAELDLALQAYQKLVSSPEGEHIYQNINKAWGTFMVLDRKLLEFSEAGDSSFVKARSLATGESAAAFSSAIKFIEDDVALNSRGGSTARTIAATNYRLAIIFTGVLVAVALAVGICVATLITRSITVPLRNSVTIAETVARGDLTSHIEAGRRDELGQLLQSLKNMNSNLTEVVSGIRGTTDSVTLGAREIASGNTDLSSRTEEQAASLEETASSMTQLTETVKQNADNAREANALAVRATDMADTGNDAMQGMIATIEKISGSSIKISEITGVIEGIAFQTNILALNAAVEAARAGAQGRGFAVVASEVRNLAQRSAEAAKEIKELIGSSVTVIQHGATQAADVGATITQVKEAIKHVSDIVSEIAAASEEQSRGIEQINQAVVQMDEVTQQNAALVEQAAAAAQSLEEQATHLNKAVSVFKLADAHGQMQPSVLASKPHFEGRKAFAARKSAKPVEQTSAVTTVAGTTALQARATGQEWETF